MTRKNAKWLLLTHWLIERNQPSITMTWAQLGEIVGGLPNSATVHFDQWWHGDRPNTRAWRAAGYELAKVQLGQTLTLVKLSDSTKLQRSKIITSSSPAPWRTRQGPVQHLGGEGLTTIDLRSALIVLPCSKGKNLGGAEQSATSSPSWSPELLRAREQMRDRAQMDDQFVMPAWQRYNGHFYVATQTSLSEAVSAKANIAILSGGYGVVRAEEEIGWYERPMKKSEWPRGVIEAALISEAVRVGARYVVAFTARTSQYTKIIKNTRWREAGIERAVLVTSHSRDGGAMRKVPADLGDAFRALWLGLSDEFPADIWCEELT